jgi:glycosyltransferase involved in cell wall biosynthesis
MKRILFLTSSFFPRKGGVEKHLQLVSERLLTREINVDILVIDSNCKGKSKELYKGIRVRRFKIEGIFGWYKARYFILKNLRKLKRYDAVHFHDNYFLWKIFFVIIPIFKILGIPYYITYHGWEGVCPPKKASIVKRKITQHLARNSIIIGDFITKWYGSTSKNISYGMVSPPRKHREDTIPYKVLFLGGLREDTNVIKIVKAFSKLPKKYTLDIAGDGQCKDEIDTLLRLENIDNVIIHGWVDSAQSLIEQADIVIPTGFLSLLEASIYRKKIVLYYDNELKYDYYGMIPGSRNMFSLVSNNDEFLAAVKELSSNPQNNNINAFNFAKPFTIDSMADLYMNMWFGDNN